MNTLRQTLTLAATIARAFWRDPTAVLGMIGHRWLGNPERSRELADKVTKAGAAKPTEPPETE